MKVMSNDPDMLEEYDFSKGIRGKYSKEYKKGTNVVFIDPEVAEFFPDENSVNDALRSLIPIIKKEKKELPNKGIEMDWEKLVCFYFCNCRTIHL